MSKISDLPRDQLYKHVGILGVLGGAGAYGIFKYLRYKRSLTKEVAQSANAAKKANDKSDPTAKKKTGRLDREFFSRLKMLLGIVVPTWKYVHIHIY